MIGETFWSLLWLDIRFGVVWVRVFFFKTDIFCDYFSFARWVPSTDGFVSRSVENWRSHRALPQVLSRLVWCCVKLPYDVDLPRRARALSWLRRLLSSVVAPEPLFCVCVLLPAVCTRYPEHIVCFA